VTDMMTGYEPSAADLNRFANRRTPSRMGTARSRSIAIDVIVIEVPRISLVLLATQNAAG
jgi:hypothetical protein